eukprot:Awhi_evm1s6701
MVDLGSNCITEKGISYLCEALKRNTRLKTLDLSGNDLNDAAGFAIANLLKHNKSITTLNLNDSQIGSVGMLDISESLASSNTTLTTLSLGGNLHGSQMAQALANNRTLTFINLSNTNLLDSGATLISQALQFNTKVALNMMSLSGNRLGNNGAKEVANFLLVNKSLSYLGLRQNDISAFGLEKI